MNRIIKFRGQRLDNKEWIYGHFLEQGVGCYISKSIIDRPNEYIGVDKESVGQFTGLSDKNGKEIYEGDIILANGSKYVKIYDMSGARQFVCSTIKDIGHTETARSKYEVYWQDCFAQFGFRSLSNHSINSEVSNRDYEVIGNIHENRELIEKSV